MPTLIEALLLVTLGLYGAVATLACLDLVRPDGSAWARRYNPALLALGLLSHGSLIVVPSLLDRSCPVFQASTALSLAGWLSVATLLFLPRARRLSVLVLVLAPMVAVFVVGGAVTTVKVYDGATRSLLLSLHVGASLLGVASFLLAGSAAAMYLVQERLLKGKRFPTLRARLPALQVLQGLMIWALVAGWLQLTLALVVAPFLDGGAGPFRWLRLLVAYGSWAISAIVLLLRFSSRWGTRRAAWGAIVGAALVMLVATFYAFVPGLGGTP